MIKSCLIKLLSEKTCNIETEDCVEFYFCSKDFTEEISMKRCGKKSICCDKDDNILNVKIPNCGLLKSQNPMKFIKLPWSVSIEENNKQICAASLINSRIVLAQGQCLSGKNPESLNVKLGSWVAGGKFGYEETRQAAQIIIHPKFTKTQMNDNLALIVLSTPSSNNPFINPICLPTTDENFIGKSCVLIGFEDKSSTRMNVEDMKVAPCGNFPQLSTLLLPPNSICTEINSEMKLSSKGSGLMCPIDEDNSIFKLAGVLMHGNDFTPSVFVETSKYREWIDEKMAELEIDNGSYVFGPITSRFINFKTVKQFVGKWIDKAEIWFNNKFGSLFSSENLYE